MDFRARMAYEVQQVKEKKARDIQDQAERPEREPALFDAYGTHESLRQD